MLIGKVANILTFLILCNDLTSIMFLCLKVLCFFKAKISLGVEVNFFLLPRHQSPQPSHKSSHEVKKGLEVCFISKKLVLDTASVDLLHPGRRQVTKKCGPPLFIVSGTYKNLPLFVLPIGGPPKNVCNFCNQFMTQFSMLHEMVPFFIISKATLILS